MKFGVLALDYDGTITEGNGIHPEVASAIGELRRAGIVVVLVTGRVLAALRREVRDLRLFDAVVGENGAVLTFPESGRSPVLGRPPPAALLEALTADGVDWRRGDCVVEADASDAPKVLRAIRQLQLPLSIAFNRGRAMVLPQSISKSTGLREALAALRLSAHNTVGIGDAENDHELLEACEIGVAVEWGSPALKAVADEILEGNGPEAVAHYIRALARQPRLSPRPTGRHRLLLGSGTDEAPIYLCERGRNLLICGDPRSGKSWVAGLLSEQLILHRYSVCAIDPEGDYWSLEALPGVVVLGADTHPPAPAELVHILRHPDVSPVIDLSRMSHGAKREYVAALLLTLKAIRRSTGFPHRILLDEAHYFLHGANAIELLDAELGGYTLISYRASGIDPGVRAMCETIVVTRESDLGEIEALVRAHDAAPDRRAWEAALGDLLIDEGVLLPCGEEAGGLPRRFRIAPRLTPHVRHQHKYLDVPVAEGQAFVFTRPDAPPGPRVRTLGQFVEVLKDAEPHHIGGHLERQDFSRWIDVVFGDHTLGARIRELERQYQLGSMRDVGDALIALIEERYPVRPLPRT